jgi:hypothetical protein
MLLLPSLTPTFWCKACDVASKFVTAFLVVRQSLLHEETNNDQKQACVEQPTEALRSVPYGSPLRLLTLLEIFCIPVSNLGARVRLVVEVSQRVVPLVSLHLTFTNPDLREVVHRFIRRKCRHVEEL